MTTAQIIAVSIDSEQDVANVRNVARLSARVLNLPVTAQARVGWAVAYLARLMLTLGYQDTMTIAHTQRNGRFGVRITCRGKWLHLVAPTWLEGTALAGVSPWVDEMRFVEGNPPSFMVVLWAPEEKRSDMPKSSYTLGV